MSGTVQTYGTIAHAEVEHNGITRTLVEWAELLDIDYDTLRMRYKRGKTGADLLYKPHVRKVAHSMEVLQALNPELKLQLVAQADKMELDPVTLLNQMVEHYLQKLASRN